MHLAALAAVWMALLLVLAWLVLYVSACSQLAKPCSSCMYRQPRSLRMV
jgi:hypothetical protein